MSLFSMLLGGPALPTPVADIPGAGDDYWYSSGGSYSGQLGTSHTHTGVRISPEISMKVSAVHQAVSLIAKTLASLPIVMYKNDVNAGTRVVATQHPLNFVLSYRPNRWQTAYDFKALMQTHLLMRGNAYAEIIPGERGAVTWLEPIHPDLVEVERIQDGTLRYRVTEWNGNIRLLLQEEMFHIRSSHCPNGITGLSPIAYAKETIALSLAAEEHASRVFANGARPGLAIKMKGRLKEEDFQRFKARFNEAYSGLANAHRAVILEEGMEVQPLTMTADEVAFIATRAHSIEDIARFFDVPLVLLHSVTKMTSWGTGVEQVMAQFARGTLRSWMTSWQEAIARDLIVAPFLYSAEFDTSQLIRGDSASHATYLETLVRSKIVTPNEARATLGYNPTEWGNDPITQPGDPQNSSDASPGGGSSDNRPSGADGADTPSD